MLPTEIRGHVLLISVQDRERLESISTLNTLEWTTRDGFEFYQVIDRLVVCELKRN